MLEGHPHALRSLETALGASWLVGLFARDWLGRRRRGRQGAGRQWVSYSTYAGKSERAKWPWWRRKASRLVNWALVG